MIPTVADRLTAARRAADEQYALDADRLRRQQIGLG